MTLNRFSFGVFLNEGVGNKCVIGVVCSYIVEGAAQVIGSVRGGFIRAPRVKEAITEGR